MLVKIVSEYGVKPTLVVWDAGMSGREEVYDEYKAGRRERPDLLSEQWPHMRPLVEAFGYQNLRVDGYEADDVIADDRRQGEGEGHRRDGRDRRPRPLPAHRRRHPR